MPDWVETKIRDVAVLNYGRPLTFLNRQHGQYPVYGSAGFLGFHFEPLIDSEGIIIGRKGNVGKVYMSSKPFWPIDTVYYIEKNKINCDFIFLFYLLQTLGLDGLNEDTAVPGLNRETIYELKFPLPSPAEQLAIGLVLSSFDEKITILERQNQTLKSMIEAVFKQRFLVEAQDNWPLQPLSYFGNIVSGQTPSKKVREYYDNGTIPFIKIPDMHDQVFVFTTNDSLTKTGARSQSKRFIPPKSILVSCLGTVGLVSLNVHKSQTNQQINTIIPNKSNYRYYLFSYLRHLSDELTTLASGSTVTPNLNLTSFSQIQIPLPDENCLDEFNNNVLPIFERIFTNTYQIFTLNKLKLIIMPRLINGTMTLLR
ncbi:MAG: restriction endonuclease subunit S [Deltaproteobacteria bacterium]|jgi:type I restriction enzyme S subunit|nr:restriction endonuclease subunit S [Deltaproteobacteria bacterium]